MDAPVRLPAPERFGLAFDRARALAIDTLLVAYALWGLSFVGAYHAGEIGREGWLVGGAGFLGRRPWLLLLAPLAAVVWEALGTSLGQRANRVRLLGPDGEGASRDRRAFRGVLAAGEVVVVLFPAVLGVLAAHDGRSAPHLFGLSGLLALAFVALALVDPRGRGLPDTLARTCTARRPAKTYAPHRAWWLRANAWVVLGLLAVTLWIAVVLTRFRPWELVANFDDTLPLWTELLHPDGSIVVRVLEKIVETVFLALMASVLALPFAFVLSFLGARNVTAKTPLGRVVYVLARVFMNVTRSIEPLLWVIIFSLWVGVGPDAGMLALLVHSVAALGKLYSEAIESIDAGPVEAIQATGARPLQVIRYGIVPQVIPPFLSFTVYRWDINVRMATILGLVGGGGIGQLLMAYMQMSAWSKVGTIVVFITLVVWAMDWASSKARQHLN